MYCPKCEGPMTVLKTWENQKGELKRRRECLECGHRITTIEVIWEAKKRETAEPVVLECIRPQKRRKPYGLSDMYIALRLRQEVAAGTGDDPACAGS